MSDLLTAEEIAKRLQLRPSTIKRWAQDGFIPCLRLTGKVVRFDLAEVERALTSHAKARLTGRPATTPRASIIGDAQ